MKKNMMPQSIIAAGMLFLFLGIVLILTGSFWSAMHSGERRTETGIFGMIGFIPFGFATDKRLFYLGLALTVFFFLLFLILGRGRHG
ncbi:DUF131 domain-containing protein [Candidatus Woesearchaeota archaeon]|nr:MAG: hypothetical protein QS99_C0008G0007 [archaeon GW2011_AR4]MBS3129650.1 DUF131 domain-containing protein [Candidatus Woesearchaeota archaeon]HIH38754.1 DUF131 domain-containing protein [Candidatus Woesearchaeota archaeon]HIH48323.1 DUF131 domain-containing protein [Candidatus Woesearchaeota archaeon]HIJ03312.1 DUF131 domain-containing protein [Candidatus Woesearchaeota archaeon]